VAGSGAAARKAREPAEPSCRPGRPGRVGDRTDGGATAVDVVFSRSDSPVSVSTVGWRDTVGRNILTCIDVCGILDISIDVYLTEE
jgi:hypothetical protein